MTAMVLLEYLVGEDNALAFGIVLVVVLFVIFHNIRPPVRGDFVQAPERKQPKAKKKRR